MTEPRACAVLLGVLLFTAIGCAAACADETVQIADSAAVLLRPSSPVASVILMPGGDGLINAGPNGQINRSIGNQLVRTRNAYLARGLAVLVANADIDLARAVQFMGEIKKPVTVIATSRGTIRTAEGDCSRSKTECARAHLRISDGGIRRRPQRRLDPRRAQCAGAHARHSPSR